MEVKKKKKTAKLLSTRHLNSLNGNKYLDIPKITKDLEGPFLDRIMYKPICTPMQSRSNFPGFY